MNGNKKIYTVIDKGANPYEMDGKKGISHKVCLRVEQGGKVSWSTPKCSKDTYDSVAVGDSGTAFFDEYGRFGGFLDE